MFSQLFFILLTLMLINFTPDVGLTFWIKDSHEAFQWGLLSYGVLLILLYGQARSFAHAQNKRWQAVEWALVNVELLFFLSLYHFGFGAQRFFSQGFLTTYQSPMTLASLFLYFFALGWAYLWHFYFQLNRSLKKSLKSAYQQLLFYCPFCLPFIAMSFLLDGWENLMAGQIQLLPVTQDVILSFLSLILLGFTFVFLPALMIVCWRCRPLDRFDLKERLERMCTSLHFRHAGLKTWSIMPHAFTAGIIGIVPAFRYILFSPALLHRFRPEEIEAVLIHEIGHNRHRHLLFYPFIMLGMLVSGALVLIGIENFLSSFLEPISSEASYFTVLVGIFILYAALMGLYFRLVFGFFSRLFERQADLYIFESSLSPIFLIQALDHLGVVTGYTHSHPSWHHFSLQERIRFLYQALDAPALIPLHHRRVKKWLLFYFFVLLMSCLVLYWVV